MMEEEGKTLKERNMDSDSFPLLKKPERKKIGGISNNGSEKKEKAPDVRREKRLVFFRVFQ